MKRFMASAFIILIIPFVFPLFVKASNYNVEWLKEQIEEVTEFHVTNSTQNNNTCQSVLDSWSESGKDLVICKLQNGNIVVASDYSNLVFSQTYPYTIRIYTPCGWGLFATDNTSAFKIDEINTYWDGIHGANLGQYVNIDFSNIYYSAQIPVPSIDVYMGSSIENPRSGEAVWNASIEIGDNSQFYVQYGYKVSFPSYIDIGLASLRGDFSYNYYNYVSTDYIDIVGMQSLTTAVNQSKSALYFQSGWQDFYDNYLTDSLLPEFGTQVNAMSTSMLNNAKDYYIDYMMTQLPMYGNRLEVFARYFLVDEENDNHVVVGAWNHWNSKDGSRTKERPSNYIDNVALPGNIITNSDPDYQDNSDTYSTNGDSTGTPATIINNNYAPNYPDYPTVATYNHDNILLNFMNTAKQLPSFFGEYTSFLTVAFGFIPSWIWNIIGMGFTFSIVIMIIKVL